MPLATLSGGRRPVVAITGSFPDRVAVLRPGRDNGFFDVTATSQERVISFITGASAIAATHRPTRSGEAWP